MAECCATIRVTQPQVTVRVPARTFATFLTDETVVSLRLNAPVIRCSSQPTVVRVSAASGPPGPPGPASETAVPIYVGPLAGAPSPDYPVLLVLREAGAPAGQTSLVVREP